MKTYLIEGVNPEPWEAPEVQVIRRGKAAYPQFHSPPRMMNFKEAFAAEFEAKYGKPMLDDEHLALCFFLWRDRETYEVNNRRKKRNQADATNCQKLIEDSLQGILYANDRSVHDIRTRFVEHGPGVNPRILICAFPADEIEPWVLQQDELLRAKAAKTKVQEEPQHDRTHAADIF